MAKRVFIAFAVEDSRYRDFLVGQARNEKSPFEFVDMSVKEPWSESWKTRCRTKIKGCDGMIALVSKNSINATGECWEVSCAKEERVPIRGVYIDSQNKPSRLPSAFDGIQIVNWTWDNIKYFIGLLGE